MRAPRLASLLANWAARASVVLGGVALLDFVAPRPAAEPAAANAAPAGKPADDTAKLGRGQPDTPPTARARAAGHETRDLSGGTLALLVAGLGGTAAGVIALMIGVMSYLDHSQRASEPQFTAQQTTAIVPPPPNLQAAPLSDIADLHQREESLLANYAWINPGHTRARVPVARAMAVMVGRRLDDPP